MNPPRPRTGKNRTLPENLYPIGKYWRYRNPITGVVTSINKPMAEAIKLAKLANAKLARLMTGLMVDADRHFIFQPNRAEPGPDTRGDALSVRRLWVELDPGEGPVDVLRGIDLSVNRGETVALMGRNGAGKSTLLRAAAGLVDPVKGKIATPGGIALLSQNPGDYLVRERVGDELSGPEAEAALEAVGLDVSPDADPRDLSGGERQRDLPDGDGPHR